MLTSKERTIFETEFWTVKIMSEQNYLGRCIVVLKRECGDLAEIKEEEMIDFLHLVTRLQNLLRKTFDATMFNWSCLMNHAYRETLPNPQVHWHVKPRYNHPVLFEGRTFVDPNFGHEALRGEDSPSENIISSELQLKLVETLKKNL